MLAGEDVSLEESKRILALAEELGTTEEILMARITFGLAHASSGDPDAAVDVLERALELAREANSHLVGRACVNLASVLGIAGDLGRSAQLHREGVELARRFGSRLEHWLVVECALDDFIAGDWDAAVAEATSYLEHRGDGAVHGRGRVSRCLPPRRRHEAMRAAADEHARRHGRLRPREP